MSTDESRVFASGSIDTVPCFPQLPHIEGTSVLPVFGLYLKPQFEHMNFTIIFLSELYYLNFTELKYR